MYLNTCFVIKILTHFRKVAIKQTDYHHKTTNFSSIFPLKNFNLSHTLFLFSNFYYNKLFFLISFVLADNLSNVMKLIFFYNIKLLTKKKRFNMTLSLCNKCFLYVNVMNERINENYRNFSSKKY